jgi:hypothetical protein
VERGWRPEQELPPEQAWDPVQWWRVVQALRRERGWRLAQEWRLAQAQPARAVAARLNPRAGSARFSAVLFLSRFPFPALAAARKAQPGLLEQQAAAPPWVGRAAQDAQALPGAAGHEASALPRAAEHEALARAQAVEHGASGPQAAEHAGLQAEVALVAAAAERRAAAEPVGEVLRPEARVAPVAPPSAAPWAVVWAFHRDQAPPWPAPRPGARSARAMKQRPVAAP